LKTDTLLKSFYRRLKAPVQARQINSFTRTRQQVELLEDRALLSGLSVTGIGSALTPTDLVTSLLGPGVSVSNIQFTGHTGTAGMDFKNGDSSSAGSFTGGAGIIGFDSGIILSSGGVQNVVGPNTTDSITQDNLLGGDADLDTLTSGITFDATELSFDFVPTFNTVTFQYTFTSDEYNEWANTPYNDVFGFFLNGSNVALLPMTDTGNFVVSINNVNGGNPPGTGPQNAAFYINNDIASGAPRNTEMDGMTTVLSVIANVNANQVNHIKLAIADTGDSIYDSNVLIKATSFTRAEIELQPDSGTDPIGGNHTVTATITDDAGVPQPGVVVSFMVGSGPNKGTTGSNTTDVNGQAAFTYADNGGVGTDTIVAQFTNSASELITSAPATQTWTTEGETPPSITPPSQQFSDEGASQLFDLGSFSDPEGGPWSVVVNWDDGSPDSTLPELNSEGSLGTQSHVFAEEGSYNVTVTVTDTDNGQSFAASFNVLVSDLAVLATGATTFTTVQGVYLPGSIATQSQLLATFVDPGGAEPNPADRTPNTVDGHYIVIIDWGDSSPNEPAVVTYNGVAGDGSKTNSFNVTGGPHLYTTTGTKTITVMIDHEGTLTTVIDTVEVVSVLNHVPGGGSSNALVIGTDPAGQVVRVVPVGKQTGKPTDSVQVFIGSSTTTLALQGTYTNFESILINGQSGNDDLEVGSKVVKNATLYGGAGNDRLQGGKGHNILLGGDGNDTIADGNGYSLLIGGKGTDRLTGKGAGDILIGDSTDFDDPGNHTRVDALYAIFNAWKNIGRNANTSYPNRAAAVVSLFSTNATNAAHVHDDGSADVLTGGSSLDLFFAGVMDSMTDRKRKEKVLTSGTGVPL
jgi:hypothetical protein